MCALPRAGVCVFYDVFSTVGNKVKHQECAALSLSLSARRASRCIYRFGSCDLVYMSTYALKRSESCVCVSLYRGNAFLSVNDHRGQKCVSACVCFILRAAAVV